MKKREKISFARLDKFSHWFVVCLFNFRRKNSRCCISYIHTDYAGANAQRWRNWGEFFHFISSEFQMLIVILFFFVAAQKNSRKIKRWHFGEIKQWRCSKSSWAKETRPMGSNNWWSICAGKKSYRSSYTDLEWCRGKAEKTMIFTLFEGKKWIFVIYQFDALKFERCLRFYKSVLFQTCSKFKFRD